MISGLQFILAYLSKAPVELIYILLVQKYKMIFRINYFIIRYLCVLNLSIWEIENTSHTSINRCLPGWWSAGTRVTSLSRFTQDFDHFSPKISPEQAKTIGHPSRDGVWPGLTIAFPCWTPFPFSTPLPLLFEPSDDFCNRTQSVDAGAKEEQGGDWDGTWRRLPKWVLSANVNSLSLLPFTLLLCCRFFFGGLVIFFCLSASVSFVCWPWGNLYGGELYTLALQPSDRSG